MGSRIMTVRELINELMNLNLDKPIYITEPTDNSDDKTIGYIGHQGIKISDLEIVEADIHGVYGEYFNCLTVKKISES